MANKQTMKKMLPIGIAVGAGALLLYFTTRKANAGQLPPPPDGGGNNDGGGGNDSGGGGGTSGGNAPPFQSRASAANSVIDSYYIEWAGALGSVLDARGSSGPATMDDMRAAKQQLGIPSGRTPGSWFADETMRDIYNLAPGAIPNNANSTWTPWKNEWNRVWNRFTAQPLDPSGG